MKQTNEVWLNGYSYLDEMRLACDRYEEWLSSLDLG